jgi:hypothetical protein
MRIKLDNLGHVLREIEHDRDVTALSGKRSPPAAAENWSAVLTADGDCGDYIVGVFGKDHSDRNLAVIGSVGGVEGAAAVVEPYFTAEMAAQCGFESFSAQHSAVSLQLESGVG